MPGGSETRATPAAKQPHTSHSRLFPTHKVDPVETGYCHRPLPSGNQSPRPLLTSGACVLSRPPGRACWRYALSAPELNVLALPADTLRPWQEAPGSVPQHAPPQPSHAWSGLSQACRRSARTARVFVSWGLSFFPLLSRDGSSCQSGQHPALVGGGSHAHLAGMVGLFHVKPPLALALTLALALSMDSSCQ